MLIKTNYKDGSQSIYQCDVCGRKVRSYLITRYEKQNYQDNIRLHKYETTVRKDLCYKCSKRLDKAMIKFELKLKELYEVEKRK